MRLIKWFRGIQEKRIQRLADKMIWESLENCNHSMKELYAKRGEINV